MAKNKLISGVAYVAGFGAGVCAAICAGQAFEAVVPEAANEIGNVVRKVGKFGCETVAHNVVSNAVKDYATDILSVGEMSATMVQGMVSNDKAKAQA